MSNVLDIIGPVMIGPSSSHTAGAARLGRIALELLDEPAVRADIALFGSFAKTYRGHGTDRALVAGILGFAADDVRLRDSLAIAAEHGLAVSFTTEDGEDVHPNTARIALAGASGRRVEVLGSSVGGGAILITQIDGMAVHLTGQHATFIVLHRDVPGLIAAVTDVLADAGANICDFHLSRARRGGDAVMSIEVEGLQDEGLADRLARLDDVTGAIMLKPLA